MPSAIGIHAPHGQPSLLARSCVSIELSAGCVFAGCAPDASSFLLRAHPSVRTTLHAAAGASGHGLVEGAAQVADGRGRVLELVEAEEADATAERVRRALLPISPVLEGSRWERGLSLENVRRNLCATWHRVGVR